MLEVPWPDLGKALVTGLLAGGASIAVQCLVPFTVRALARLRKRGVGDGAMRVERRLAAILAADVVGYSRQMVADEEGTHTRLLSYRREVIEPKIREHRGRMVKNTGDGALVEFGSIVDAVRCALEMQRGIIARNAGVLPTRRIELRASASISVTLSSRPTTFMATASTSRCVSKVLPHRAASASPQRRGAMHAERSPPRLSTLGSSSSRTSPIRRTSIPSRPRPELCHRRPRACPRAGLSTATRSPSSAHPQPWRRLLSWEVRQLAASINSERNQRWAGARALRRCHAIDTVTARSIGSGLM